MNDDDLFRQYLQGLEIIGTGGKDSLGSVHPAVKGALLSEADNVNQVAGTQAAKPATGLVVGAPDEGVAARLSPDVATNTQPLPEFQASPPGSVPSGSVRVGF